MIAPALLVAVALLPVLAGLAGTLGPGLSAAAWLGLVQTPGLSRAVLLSLWSGVSAALLSLLLAHVLLAALGTARARHRARLAALPLIAMPHLALAIGVVLVLAPSGLLLRLLSPWLTGFTQPPDWPTVQDPWGISLIIGLVLKETPFLLLALSTAVAQVPAERLVQQARTLGYGPMQGWLFAVAPLLQRQIALPFAAVLVFGISNVDVAIALGPTTPPTFAVLLWEWFVEPDLSRRPLAAAGALALMALGLLALAVAWLAGGGLRRALAARAATGRRAASELTLRRAALIAAGTGALLGLLALAALWLRSMTPAWRFPTVWPRGLGLAAWREASESLAPAWSTTLLLGIVTALLALLLCTAASEALRKQARARSTLAALLFLPLIVPQFSFLFGLQVLLARTRLDATWMAVIWSHLVYVLPYVFGIVASARTALDARFTDVARTLGAGALRTFGSVTLPLLARALLLAAALGFAVSVAVYLPTLFAGAGRIATLATEAAATISAGNLRAAAVAAALLAALPLLALLAATLLGALLHRGRRGMPS